LATGAITITINSNALLPGIYTNAIAVSADPYVESTLTGSALNTLRPLVAAWLAATTAPVTSAATLGTFGGNGLDLGNVIYATGTATGTTLVVKMALAQDADHLPVYDGTDGTDGLTSVADFLLVVQ